MFKTCKSQWCCVILRGMASMPRTFYEALGVKTSATQAEIKSAYYELSKLHHPDINKGSEESLTKFRQVAEAYEVLGNTTSRKMYDRGLVVSGSGTTLRNDGHDFKSYKARRDNRTVPTNVDSTHYDFDAWTRAHYVQTKRRKDEIRSKYNMEMARAYEDKRANSIASVWLSVGLFVFTYFALSSYLFTEDYDQVKEIKKEVKPT